MRGTKRKIIKGIMMVCGLLPIKKNKIIFSSYHGTSYSCNPRYISEELQKRNYNLDIVWVLPKNYPAPKEIRVINEKSLRALYEFSTAKIWVDNSRKSIWMRKRKEQCYIQTWHGGIALKKIEGYAENNLPKEYIESAKHDSEMADLFLSNSKWLSHLYRDCFWYTGEIMEKGLPREDMLYYMHESFYQAICKFYGVPLGTKFMLYAPTFRNSGELDCYDLEYKRIIEILEKVRGGKWKIIVRLHPNIQAEQYGIYYDEDVLNGSKYEDINHLIMASELFVSDYSSCMFDAMNAGCDVILYASDIAQYEDERGFLFDWEELPFLVAANNDIFEEYVKYFDRGIYKRKVEDFNKRCGMVEGGHASEYVADYVMKIIQS